MKARRRVLFVTEWIPAYRVHFFAALTTEMAKHGVRVDVVTGDPPSDIAARRDSRVLPGAECRTSRSVPIFKRELVWQPWLDEAKRSDLVVVNEGSRFLLNYVLIARQRLLRSTPVAFWGHGANLDALNSHPLAERVKHSLYRLPHWWFAYTEGSRDRVRQLGFREERITVVQNAPPTEELIKDLERVRSRDLTSLRKELGLEPGPVGLFLGSLYPTKRLDYLFDAADRIFAARPDFSLLIVGDGPGRTEVAQHAAHRSYVRQMGRLDGVRKALTLRFVDLLLLPGAVGLSLMDGFAAGVPTISTAIPTHGPEIEYLDDGRNGILLDARASTKLYAEAVLGLLADPTKLDRLAQGARIAGRTYTGSAMVQRFAVGLDSALIRR